MASGWGGWGRGGSASAPADPSERDRRAWLTANGITPMNRSTRLWDMEIKKTKWIPHLIEQVGSLDMVREVLDAQARGEQVLPLVWSGSRDMATGRAYDWCYCIEAARPDDDEVDGRTQCVCTCKDCKPVRKSDRAVHWRKRSLDSRLHAQAVKARWDQHYYERRLYVRIWRRLQHLGAWWVALLSDTPEPPHEDGPEPIRDYEMDTVPIPIVPPEADEPEVDEEDLEEVREGRGPFDWDGPNYDPAEGEEP